MRLFLLVLAVVHPVFSESCPSDTTYDSIMNRCYKYMTVPLAYQQAQQFCQDSGGSLVNILNATENFFLAEDSTQRLYPHTSFWLGLTNLNGNWQWNDGSSVGYNSWAQGEPGNSSYQCAVAKVSTGMWYHSRCTEEKAFICAYVANPTTTAAPTTTHGPKCSPTMTYFSMTDSCYYVGSGAPFWTAESMCIELGGHLTSIHNAYENNFVMGLTSIGGTQKAEEMTWIGMHYTGKDWIWTDGSSNTFTNWEPGMPFWDYDKCVELLQDDYNKKRNVKGTWNNQPCKWEMRKFVCKVPPLW